MAPFALTITQILSLATIALELGCLVLAIALVKKKRRIVEWVGTRALWFGFVIASGSVIASLYYSDFVGYYPCTLCWVQRIFLYPQAILLGLAAVHRDYNIVKYSLALSLPGGSVALYHTFIQFGGTPLVPCSAEVVSCSQRFFVAFGYITIPTMSLTAFVALTVLAIAARSILKNKMSS